METTLTSRTASAPLDLAASLADWSRLPSLAAALTGTAPVYLVVDPEAGRILHATPAAAPIAGALAAADPAAVIRQVARTMPEDGQPRLARLRLDPRRIAPPMLCWLARGTRGSGGPAILVVPTGPVALSRRLPEQTAARSEEQPAAPVAPDSPAQTRADRFLWRIDAAGILTTLTGPEGLAALVGRSWRELAAEGRIAGADAILAALQERRTFRAETAMLDGGAGVFHVELSGTPTGRGDAAVSGFGGFGLIRAAPASSPAAAAIPATAPPAARPAVAPTAPAPAPSTDPAGIALSTDEHAAFREIARALGARYAGDEASGVPTGPKAESGAIMPFPGVPATPADLRTAMPEPYGQPDPGILAELPLPALVHRGDAILWANRLLLDLTGYPDLAALATAGLGRLFRGLPQTGAIDPAARRTTVQDAAGQTRPVDALGGACRWHGEAATGLIIRPLDEADLAGALTAERLARAAQAERALRAEAALDALETGIVTVDGAGRIVGLNRAAADLVGGEPREIVGGSFVGLFDRDSVLAVADILRGIAAGPRTISLSGTPVSLLVSAVRADGGRVVRLDPLRPVPEPVGRATPAPGGDDPAAPAAGAVLSRLDHAFREPLAGMIHLAGAMLKEPFGPLGDARYRGCLTDIKASGEAMLERVGDLLDLATVEAGALRLDPRPLVLNDVVAACVRQLQAEAARGRIVVRTSFSPDLSDLEADERSVSRAACLVIEHAIRRSTAGGQIIVSTSSAERAGIALRVRDTGAGAARPTPPHDPVADDLALPRALVEANGGRLRLSAQPEDGTLVEIIMPTRRAAGG